ncbi:PD-(D/E)XK motif protein [Sphingomonas carotinifaciens]|uniref:PD-(D/E)XK motif protein n=1 Tax=Sphingomonas carotinifaciens TaxID=1166323 RepID=UPI0039A1683B
MRTESGLAGAWRSLTGEGRQEGWRVIQIEGYGSCVVHAGRRLPGNEEAVLVSFPETRIPPSRHLPHGHGFEVSRLAQQIAGPHMATIGLVREPAGSLELFETMADDVMRVLRRGSRGGDKGLLELFLRRVAAWQDFMRRPGDDRLSNEQEVGLFGELVMLEQLIRAGVSPVDAVECWEGPLDGLHDFAIGAGAIEVKSSIAVTGFPARIGSLEQLDDAERQPLYLAALRLAVTPDGETLAALVKRLKSELKDTGAAGVFDSRLMHAGYQNGQAELYVRSFAAAGERLFLVGSGFPRLTPTMVNPAIRNAVYSIEVDHIEAAPVALRQALDTIGIV